MSNVAQIGQCQYAQLAFNEPYDVYDHQDSVLSDGLMRCHKGWGFLGQRRYSFPGEWEERPVSVTTGVLAEITIMSVSGAIIGKIRSDIQKTIIHSLEFTIDDHGCADFLLKLNSLPDFPITDFSIAVIKIGDTDYNWYSGEISYRDDYGTQREVFEYRGNGLRNYLSGLKAMTTYTTGQDIGDIVSDLVQTWVQPYCPILYNSSKIELNTGVILANDIELSSHPLDKVFQTLSDMAGYNWGVDGDKEFYFKEKEIEVQKTFFVGYSIQDFKPKLNLTAIKNVITVQRQQGMGTGGVGWSVAGIYNDASSVKKYGRKELNYQIPGYFADDEADIVGESLLVEKKEPKQSGRITGFLVFGGDQYLSRGNYRFILPFDKFDYIYSEVDDVTEWMKSGPGDLAITKEEDLYVYGDGCLKLTFSNALNDRAEFQADCKLGKIQKIRFFVKASRVGTFLTAGVGYGLWSQNTIDIDIHVVDTFINYDWDISALNISQIDRFAVRIDATPGAETNVYIDKIEFVIAGHRYYTLQLKETKYKFAPTKQSAEANFGVLPPKMENYIASLFETATELKFTQEIR